MQHSQAFMHNPRCHWRLQEADAGDPTGVTGLTSSLRWSTPADWAVDTGGMVLLFTGDWRMPRWQHFLFFVWGWLIVISHLMLTRKLLRAGVTTADDSFVLSPLGLRLLMLWFSCNLLWLRHKWDGERKHRLENALKAPVSKPVVSLGAVGDSGRNNCCCCCCWVQVQIPRPLFCVKSRRPPCF